MKFEKVNDEAIEKYRDQYLTALGEAQELFMEWIVRKSDYYLIVDEETIGYCVISPDRIMVEFYLIPSVIKDCERIFESIIHDLKVVKIYCKSFDSLLLKCCLKSSSAYKVKGTLFRDFIDTDMDGMEEFVMKRAKEEDIPLLLNNKDDLYESVEELYQMVRDNNIRMYYHDGQLVGCGFLIKVIDGQDYCDIGMWVKTEYRKKGYATRIIANLKGYCLKNHMMPICGCDANNLASRRTLEKNGFFSRYDLIEFDIES